MPYVPPKLISATPQEDYTIILQYEDGKTNIFDVTPLLEISMYEPLKDKEFFMKSCQVLYNFVYWNDDIDIAPELLREV